MLAENVADHDGARGLASHKVTVFRCVNCSRPGALATSAAWRRSSELEPKWPISLHEIALPCAGRLQPEHLLKAFEAGADAVCVITCASDNCRYLEGSQRLQRRVGYVRELLDEVGLGGERLLVFELAGSPDADATLGRGPNGLSPGTQLNEEEIASRLTEIRERLVAGISALQPSPLRHNGATV